ncbi:MAG TPA: cation diffusion facilitator family transporter [Myxococcaceae bacterium]|nr:cation diffusion facilitator family transporter [Myxococcaceae bacterium]
MGTQAGFESAPKTVTVVVALVANLAIALAKLLAAFVSGSSAMLAEGFHALADTGNEVVLLIAQKRSEIPPDDEHPLGHGRAAYFWALIAALGVFVTGALLSIHQGIEELLHPGEATSFALAYSVLAVSLVLESVSLWRAYRQLRQEAAELSREFLEYFDLSSDPIGRAVFAEDAAAVVGNLIAAAGIGLRQLTGSRTPDAIAAVVIGLILGYVALQLARRNGDFLIGRRAPPNVHQRVQDIIASQTGLCRVTDLLVTFLGPHRLWVLARVDIDDRLSGAEVKSLVGVIEEALTRDSGFIARVDVVPQSGEPTKRHRGAVVSKTEGGSAG